MVREPDGGNVVLRQYLLGSIPETEREQLEEAFLRDENLYEELLATEDELVDEYVWDRLPETERASFLQYLGSLPDSRERLAFAQAMRSRLASTTAQAHDDVARPEHGNAIQVPVRVLALVAATLLLILGGIWASLTISKLREQVGTAQSELARLQERGDDSRVETSTMPASRSFLLTAGTLRSGGTTQVILIHREPELLELRLDLGSVDYPTYRATVHDANGLELASLGRLQARTEADRLWVVFNAPSDWFISGDYYISLLGERVDRDPEPVARYDFRVVSE